MIPIYYAYLRIISDEMQLVSRQQTSLVDMVYRQPGRSQLWDAISSWGISYGELEEAQDRDDAVRLALWKICKDNDVIWGS